MVDTSYTRKVSPRFSSSGRKRGPERMSHVAKVVATQHSARTLRSLQSSGPRITGAPGPSLTSLSTPLVTLHVDSALLPQPAAQLRILPPTKQSPGLPRGLAPPHLTPPTLLYETTWRLYHPGVHHTRSAHHSHSHQQLHLLQDIRASRSFISCALLSC